MVLLKGTTRGGGGITLLVRCTIVGMASMGPKMGAGPCANRMPHAYEQPSSPVTSAIPSGRPCFCFRPLVFLRHSGDRYTFARLACHRRALS